MLGRGIDDFTDIVRMMPCVSIITIENASPDEFPPQDVEALEIYAGVSTIPPQFAPRSFTIGVKTCGAIVIWTRLPGS